MRVADRANAAATSSSFRRVLRIAALGAAILTLAGLWLAHGSIGFYQIVVQWREGTSEQAIARVVRERTLVQRRVDPEGWYYVLGEASQANVAALLSEPSLVRVDGVDPTSLRPTEHTSSTPAEWLTMRYPELERAFGPALNRVVRPTGIVPGLLFFLLVGLVATREGRGWLERRIPAIAPLTLAVYRAACAGVLALLVAATVPGAGYRVACLLPLALFGTGVAARVSFIAFVVAYTSSQLGHFDLHEVAPPVRTLWLMTLVPWGTAPNVAALWRGGAGLERWRVASRRCGLAVWIPALMMGLAYAAAVFAKFDESGLRWVSEGAVRYFFVIDGADAPVSAGRLIARSDVLSVLASASAVLAEALVLPLVLIGGAWATLAAGLVALSLHVGFYLFQGVWWPAWWALLPAFLPWQAAVSRLYAWRTRTAEVPVPPGGSDEVAPVERSLTPLVVVLGMAMLLQPVASLFRMDTVVMSDFAMYSDVNYESKETFAEEFEAESQPPAAVRMEPDGAGDSTAARRVEDVDPNGAVLTAARVLADDEQPSDALLAELRSVGQRYADRFGAPPPTLDVHVDGWRFDWSVAAFVPRNEWERVGTVDLAAGRVGR